MKELEQKRHDETLTIARRKDLSKKFMMNFIKKTI